MGFLCAVGRYILFHVGVSDLVAKGVQKTLKVASKKFANGIESRRTARGPTTFRVVPKSNSRGSLLNYFIAILIILKQFCDAA